MVWMLGHREFVDSPPDRPIYHFRAGSEPGEPVGEIDIEVTDYFPSGTWGLTVVEGGGFFIAGAERAFPVRSRCRCGP